MKLSPAQFGALQQLMSFGPIEAVEVVGPRAMDGSRKTTFQCHCLTAPTMRALASAELVTIERTSVGRPINAVGKRGNPRVQVVVNITDAGRAALNAELVRQ